MAEEPHMDTVEVVYMGRVEMQGGKIGHRLILKSQLDELIGALADDGTIRYASSAFTPKRNTLSVIGGVYTIEAETDPRATSQLQTVRFHTAKFVRNGGYNLEPVWEATDEAIGMRKRAEAVERKAASDTRLQGMLRDLAWYYRKQAPNNRQAFKLMVLEALSK